MRTIAIAIAGLFIAAASFAFPVHVYPGLEELTAQSPDIALIRINARVAGDGQTYDTYNVTIIQTFKGNIPTDASRNIALAHIQMKDSFGSTEAGFQPTERYLVFLEPNTFTNIAGTHRNLPIIGSCWKLRPDSVWKADANHPLKVQMETLFDQQDWEKDRTEQGSEGTSSR